MENLGMNNSNLFNGVFKGKKVLITGDTGFKGSWLAIWLKELGAFVYGYALPPLRKEDNFVTCGLSSEISHLDGDIRDLNALSNYCENIQPEIIFHLAAQPLVLESYKNPHYTFETNMMGTVNVFETARRIKSIKAVINITSDKCYQNNESIWSYREYDPIGGKDPYSASKGCSELVTNSYLNSFFNDNSFCVIASARAGNVIGGGDWADYRIVPDFFRSIKMNNPLIVRNPYSTRPWQHVFEPISGYLHLTSLLLQYKNKFSGAWNFGPDDQADHTVSELINTLIKFYGKGEVIFEKATNKLHEAANLKLDISKAISYLNWKPVLTFEESVKFTVDGYSGKQDNLYERRKKQIETYVELAASRKTGWTRLNER
jgi:CDP-glucose 4,6-dehydratase